MCACCIFRHIGRERSGERGGRGKEGGEGEAGEEEGRAGREGKEGSRKIKSKSLASENMGSKF
ncbi:hypothetical protein C5F63_18890 [Photobacterium damselae subsp. damselae]|nr:hypothetical protein C5F63_18890 [Photobacterium damselae subsp. damselae]